MAMIQKKLEGMGCCGVAPVLDRCRWRCSSEAMGPLLPPSNLSVAMEKS